MGYYFSYTYDLTLSKIKRATNCQTETRFQWNYHLHKDLKKFGVDKKWQISLIQGHIGYATSFIQGKKLEYFLISRRSCFKAGTRYNARGNPKISIFNSRYRRRWQRCKLRRMRANRLLQRLLLLSSSNQRQCPCLLPTARCHSFHQNYQKL